MIHESLIPVSTRLRVLAISGHWSAKTQRPGAAIFVDRQLDSLRKLGVEVSTFDIGTSHNPFIIKRKWIEFRQLVKENKPHLVHGQYGTITGFLAAFSGAPSVVSFCGSDLLPGASVSTIRMTFGLLLSNLAALGATKIICKSNELRNALWWRKKTALVIPNGVDLEMFCPGPQDEARRKLGWNMDHPAVIFYVGQDKKNKGLDIAESAMKVVQKRFPHADLHILSKVEPNEMPWYYQAGDVLLCASKQEGSPNVIKEALACNLPVVSSSVGDVAERLAEVHPSEVTERNPEALGQALLKVLLLNKRSNGRERTESLSLDQVAKRVFDVYCSALEVKDKT